MLFLSQPRRSPRSGEWTSDRAVTFIVTLAARQAGMSRKSAYALKSRDPVFASAWAAADEAGGAASVQGDKVEEVHEPPVPSSHGDTRAGLPGAGRACVTLPSRFERERAFARLVAALRESPPLAPRAPAQ